MNKEEKELIELLENCIASDLWYEIDNEDAKILKTYINYLQKVNKLLSISLSISIITMLFNIIRILITW